MSSAKPTLECPCDGRHLVTGFAYDAPPAQEVRFKLSGLYKRCYRRCTLCGHCFSQHDMDLSSLYSGAYVDATYGAGMRSAYERIMALPPEKSDNVARVTRICAYAEKTLPKRARAPRVIDVGSGLAVFPARMREAGWDCTALDPDPKAAAHARDVAGVDAVTGDFFNLDRSALGTFDAVTFNKVLEHVEEPVAMLREAAPLLEPGGFIYAEVPDGEAASADGPNREEFFVEHHHVFSPASLALMATRAGFDVRALERLREPSGKYTVFAFLALR